MPEYFLQVDLAVKRSFQFTLEVSVSVRLKMGRLKKTDKAKKPSQVDGAVRTEDVGVMDLAVERKVILTDGNGVDG